MKQKIYHIIIFLLFWFCGVAYSQNPKADILQQDLSGLFDNLSMIGILAYIIHSGFISGYQNRYGDNLKPPTNVYHRMTA